MHKKVSGVDKIYAAIGGFHISSVGEGMSVGEFLRQSDVKLVSPCHCTSNDAKHGTAKILGERCVKNGSGKIDSQSLNMEETDIIKKLPSRRKIN